MKKIITVLLLLLLVSCDTARNRYYMHMVTTNAVYKHQTAKEEVKTIKDTISKKCE